MFEIEILGHRRKARINVEPPFDPSGEQDAGVVGQRVAVGEPMSPTLPPSVLPDISPTWGEITHVTGVRNSQRKSGTAARLISPLVGGPKDGRDPWLAPAGGSPEGGVKNRDLLPS